MGGRISSRLDHRPRAYESVDQGRGRGEAYLLFTGGPQVRPLTLQDQSSISGPDQGTEGHPGIEGVGGDVGDQYAGGAGIHGQRPGRSGHAIRGRSGEALEVKPAIREGDGAVRPEGTAGSRLSTPFQHAAAHGDRPREGEAGAGGGRKDHPAVALLGDAACSRHGSRERDRAIADGGQAERTREGQRAREGLGAGIESAQGLGTAGGRVGDRIGDGADAAGKKLGEDGAGERHGLRVEGRVMAGDQEAVIDVSAARIGIGRIEHQRPLLILTQGEGTGDDTLQGHQRAARTEVGDARQRRRAVDGETITGGTIEPDGGGILTGRGGCSAGVGSVEGQRCHLYGLIRRARAGRAYRY